MKVQQTICRDILENIKRYLAIPSPVGYTHLLAQTLERELCDFGYLPKRTRKGGVLVKLGGTGSPVCFTAHMDTLGAMVRSVNSDGTLRTVLLGSYAYNSIECENCLVHTRAGEAFSGTMLLKDSSIHVHGDITDIRRDEEHMHVVLDIDTCSRAQTAAYGISPGDHISFDPRTKITDTGYIKSRYLDDKSALAILMSIASEFSRDPKRLLREVWLFFTDFEERGHGGSAGWPDPLDEIIAVDMGCVGGDLAGSERAVSICACDKFSPYNYATTSALIDTAKRENLHYVVDVFPHYSSDATVAVKSGWDVAHGLIGPGVSASHSYERSHIDGLVNTWQLIYAYCTREFYR